MRVGCHSFEWLAALTYSHIASAYLSKTWRMSFWRVVVRDADSGCWGRSGWSSRFRLWSARELSASVVCGEGARCSVVEAMVGGQSSGLGSRAGGRVVGRSARASP